jgi:nucleoside-diphosphate kinase
MNQTFAIIKPDAVRANQIGAILSFLEAREVRVASMKMVQLTRREAEGFYAEHRGRGFFAELIEFMTSGPVVLLVLEGENVRWRYREELMGATDPAQAAPGTLRKLFARSKGENAVHGSDSDASAVRELAYFFSTCEIF